MRERKTLRVLMHPRQDADQLLSTGILEENEWRRDDDDDDDDDNNNNNNNNTNQRFGKGCFSPPYYTHKNMDEVVRKLWN
jgi:hypothetical protein